MDDDKELVHLNFVQIVSALRNIVKASLQVISSHGLSAFKISLEVVLKLIEDDSKE